MSKPQFTIVLANLMNRFGRLNQESRDRANLAIALEDTRESRKIILCGWAYRTDSSLPIAKALKAYISRKKPSLSEKLICQSMSRDTVGDAFFSRLLIEQISSNTNVKIDVVTSDYHARRASEIFFHVFGNSKLINIKISRSESIDLGLKNREEESLKAFHETFGNSRPGDLISIHSKLCLSHPYYNGIIYPRIDTLESIKESLVKDI